MPPLIIVAGIMTFFKLIERRPAPARPQPTPEINPRLIARGLNNWGYEINANGEPIHRVISELEDGPIPPGWVVHHVNGKKQDNWIDNLVQMPASAHGRLHKQFGPYLPYTKVQIRAMFDYVRNQ